VNNQTCTGEIMYRVAAACLVAAIAIAVAMHNPSIDAQQEAPSGDQLQAKAVKARDALLKGTPAELYDALAPWVRGRVDLLHERGMLDLEKRAARGKEQGKTEDEVAAEVLKQMHMRDPGDVLKLRTMADLKALKPAHMLAMVTEKLAFQADKDVAERRGARWHLVDRSVLQAEERRQFRNSMKVYKTYGTVMFASVHGDRIEITAQADSGTWEVIDFSAKVGDWELNLNVPDPSEAQLGFGPSSAHRAEAEQMLGSLRNQTRVAFAKMGESPTTLTAEMNAREMGTGVHADELVGQYFTVRDVVLSQGNLSNSTAALIADPNPGYESDGYVMITYQWGGGEPEFQWFTTPEELEAAIETFKAD
jgi:hypothetical protein